MGASRPIVPTRCGARVQGRDGCAGPASDGAPASSGGGAALSRVPFPIAIATASARLAAPSFECMLPTCQFTVLSAIESSAPIALVVLPDATRRRHLGSGGANENTDKHRR